MSHIANDNITLKAQELLQLARDHSEYWVGTAWQNKFDSQMGAVENDLASHNLEDLHFKSTPTLEETLADSFIVMFNEQFRPDQEVSLK